MASTHIGVGNNRLDIFAVTSDDGDMAEGHQPDVPKHVSWGLAASFAVAALIVILSHTLSGAPAKLVMQAPYVLFAVLLFAFLVQCGRAAGRPLTLKAAAIGGLLAWAWPLTVVVWIISHRGGGASA
jgi:hypothetical protein